MVGINVSDGMYMTQVDVDPIATQILLDEEVETDGFQTIVRQGFQANYIYLEAGDYNMVQIESKEITATFGGVSSTEIDAGSACGFNNYILAKDVAEGGSAIAVDTTGLYKVTYDNMTSEITMTQIRNANVIGSATPGGWNDDTVLSGSVDATGGTWVCYGC